MTALVSHDIGGVQGHSTTNFWDEYDLYRRHGDRALDLVMSEELNRTFGFKRMVYRYFKEGRTVVGTVLMFRKSDRAAIAQYLGLERFIYMFQDEFWTIGLPDNIGGGAFVRPMFKGNWDDPADKPVEQVGWIHEIDGEIAFDREFVFNDFTQGKHWSVDKDRIPFPGRKPTRSLGRAFTPSVGHRYGSNVHA